VFPIFSASFIHSFANTVLILSPFFVLFSLLQEVFKAGEKLSALILGIDYDYSNISLSTAELEVVDGEVISNKDQVWANAGASSIKLRGQRDCYFNCKVLICCFFFIFFLLFRRASGIFPAAVGRRCSLLIKPFQPINVLV
jgi:hypothetical protein